MLWHVMAFLSVSDMASLMLVNKSLYHLTSISPVWRQLIQNDLTEVNSGLINNSSHRFDADNISIDWFGECKRRHSSRHPRSSYGKPPMRRPVAKGWTKRNLPRKLMLGDVTEEEVQALVIDNGTGMMKAGECYSAITYTFIFLSLYLTYLLQMYFYTIRFCRR